jgi:uncharacterized protein YcbK (DUF882 family)
MSLRKNFYRFEFACSCGCGKDTVDAELLDVLVDLRANFNSPITINSGYRCKNYNKKIRGAKQSQHLYGRAADIVVKNVSPIKVYSYLEKEYPSKYGLGIYDTFVHIDTRSGKKARWDRRG